tara:strand:+ start:473 stop:898 length:426 start_codon:yes stop_codon:yes gene_type:complete
MANYLKVNAGPVAGDGIETLITINKIAGIQSVVNAANVTTIIIRMDSTATSLYTIAVPGVTGGAGGGATSASRQLDATNALNSALTANPGGVVSTLAALPALLQAPVPQGATPATGRGPQGQSAITQPATFAQYTTCIYTP